MIGWIARRELLEHVRSPRFMVLALLCVVLLPGTAYVSVSGLHMREALANDLEARRLIASDPSGPPSDQGASRFGWRSGVVTPDAALRAVRHPVAEEVLAIGSAASAPAYWQFSTEGSVDGPPARAQSPGGEESVTTDICSVIEAVLGLLAMLVACDSVSGEIESGRMRTILAHPVSRAEVLAGKFCGAYVALAIPLVVSSAAALVIYWVRGIRVAEPTFLVASAGILFASALYLATMLALGIAVSAVTSEARTSLVVLLMLWICATLAIPGVATLVASTVSPVQSEEMVRASISENMHQLERERARRLAEVWEQVSGSRDTPADGVVSPDVRSLYLNSSLAIEEQMMTRKRQIIEGLTNQQTRDASRQATIERVVGRLSPAVTFRRVTEAIAATGYEMQWRWREEVARAQHAIEAASFDRRFGMELYSAAANYQRIMYWPDATDPTQRVPAYAELPAFTHHQEAVSERIATAVPDACLLAFECIGLLIIAAMAYVRTDI